jgi:hypothetical protein
MNNTKTCHACETRKKEHFFQACLECLGLLSFDHEKNARHFS